MNQLSIDDLKKMKVPELKQEIEKLIIFSQEEVKITGLKKAELITLLAELQEKQVKDKEATSTVSTDTSVVSYEDASKQLEIYVGEDFFLPQRITQGWLDKVIEALGVLINDSKYVKIPTFIFYELISSFAYNKLTFEQLIIALDYINSQEIMLISDIHNAIKYAKAGE